MSDLRLIPSEGYPSIKGEAHSFHMAKAYIQSLHTHTIFKVDPAKRHKERSVYSEKAANGRWGLFDMVMVRAGLLFLVYYTQGTSLFAHNV